MIFNTWFETICGEDTVINSVTYKKFQTHNYDWRTGAIFDTVVRGAVRNDSAAKKMYFISFLSPLDTAEHLFYDFNLNTGNSITMWTGYMSSNTKTVDSTWVAPIAGANRKVIQFEPDFGRVEQWIEGIGSTYGFSSRGEKMQMFDRTPALACLYANGRHVYTSASSAVYICRVHDCPQCPAVNPAPCEQIVYDTVSVTVYDTSTTVVYDTASITVHDTVTAIIYDTISVTDTLVIELPLGGILPGSWNTIRIYPNPATDQLYIDNGNYQLITNHSLAITTAQGQTMFQSAFDQSQFIIDLNTLGAGLYFISIYDPQGQIVEVRKIVVR